MSSSPRRVLVVANRTSSTPALLEEVRMRARSAPHQFTLLVPDAPDRAAADWTLESALPLLQRSAKPLALTTAGKEYLEQLRPALALLAAMPLHRRSHGTATAPMRR